MDFQLKNRHFIVTGAGSGFGKAITEQLLHEGAFVLAVTRTAQKLSLFQEKFKGQLQLIETDVTNGNAFEEMFAYAKINRLSGLVVNAGGPPARSARESRPEDWDDGYNLLLRWKIILVQMLLPVFEQNNYGRILFIESASVKQPMDNLVLSTSFRLAVVGFAKTLSNEVADKGITLNVLAPGFHDTAAAERIFRKQSEQQGISIAEARAKTISQIPVQRIGNPDDIGSLALWLLSPFSNFVTGETISVDGGGTRHIFG